MRALSGVSFQGKCFSFHLLNERGAVQMEQLSRLTLNPIGLVKCAIDHTVLELLNFLWQVDPVIAEDSEGRQNLFRGDRTALKALGKIGDFNSP